MIRICSIPGDGIGQEVIPSAERILRKLVPDVVIERQPAGYDEFCFSGAALPPKTLEAALAADAVIFGAVGSPLAPTPGYRSPIVQLRREMDLFSNLRPTRGDKANLLIVRENTEGMYAGRESLSEDGNTAIAERVITRRGSERIVRKAFQEAERLGFSRVTVVHKANVLRVTDGLFRSVALEVAAQFPAIKMDELLVDTAAMHLAADPGRFEVVVTTNLFGDILSDVACIHGGGLGLAASANVGESRALFEPVHGSAPDIAGKGRACPIAAYTCIAMMLGWLGESRGLDHCRQAAEELTSAITWLTTLTCTRTEDWEGAILDRLETGEALA